MSGVRVEFLMKPSIIRIILMDLIDFMLVITPAFFLAWGAFAWYTADMNNLILGVGFEILLEAAFLVPQSAQIFLAVAVMNALAYQLFFIPLLGTTVGGKIMGLQIESDLDGRLLSASQLILRGIGTALFVLLACVGPLYAWWLDHKHRGGGDYLAKSRVSRAQL